VKSFCEHQNCTQTLKNRFSTNFLLLQAKMSSRVRAPPRKRHRPSKKHLTEFEKGKIIAWREEKLSIRAISKKMKRPTATIQHFLERFHKNQSFGRKAGSGRKRKTSFREDRAIVRTALKKKRRMTAGKSIRVV
jgi:hypothetical protein